MHFTQQQFSKFNLKVTYVKENRRENGRTKLYKKLKQIFYNVQK